jgi:hypothetical protein
MDTAVSLVQSYLYMNGYFTVTEYPVIEMLGTGEYRNVTDVDLLALRMPGMPPTDELGGPFLRSDPALQVDESRVDLIIAEVKEGKAELNQAARDPRVLAAALHRFGRVDDRTLDDLIGQLLEDGEAFHPQGARIRLVAFGGRPPYESKVPHHWMLHADLIDYLHRIINENWSAAQAIQSKDPALSFLLLLEKSVRGVE